MMDWIALFPELDGIEPEARRALLTGSKVLDLPPMTPLFGPGQVPEAALLVIRGTVRVHQVTEHGREIVLYRVQAGESCVLTTACLLAGEAYTADGVTETQATGVAIPRGVFDRMLATSAVFRTFVFTAYSRRIADLFLVIEDIAFQRMDIRLAQRLIDMAQDNVVAATHQHMAIELGSAREVISRLLKDFERRGWVSQTRGSIHLTDRGALTALIARGT